MLKTTWSLMVVALLLGCGSDPSSGTASGGGGASAGGAAASDSGATGGSAGDGAAGSGGQGGSAGSADASTVAQDTATVCKALQQLACAPFASEADCLSATEQQRAEAVAKGCAAAYDATMACHAKFPYSCVNGVPNHSECDTLIAELVACTGA